MRGCDRCVNISPKCPLKSQRNTFTQPPRETGGSHRGHVSYLNAWQVETAMASQATSDFKHGLSTSMLRLNQARLFSGSLSSGYMALKPLLPQPWHGGLSGLSLSVGSISDSWNQLGVASAFQSLWTMPLYSGDYVPQGICTSKLATTSQSGVRKLYLTSFLSFSFPLRSTVHQNKGSFPTSINLFSTISILYPVIFPPR